MRLRRKPWIEEAILEYKDYIFVEEDLALGGEFESPERHKGEWRDVFTHPKYPLYFELGSGKGKFISGMTQEYEKANFLGLEVQLGVLYYATRKLYEMNSGNAKMILSDIAQIEEIVDPEEVDRFYINFCDPWPKTRHAKRRLTHRNFLEKYSRLLTSEGEIHFKTDNEGLFLFSLDEFKECGWQLKNVTYDLHSTDLPNVQTEYEEKFSAKGQPIFRLEAVNPRRKSI